MADNLKQTIRDLNKRMHVHGDKLRGNESLTRYALIDPILTALGWNLADPEQVIPEYRPMKRDRYAVDYMLKIRGLVLLIEAKPLDKKVGNFQGELVKYVDMCRGEGDEVDFACLTNGDIWNFYEPGNCYRLVLQASLTSDDMNDCARNLASVQNMEFQSIHGDYKEEQLHGRISLTRINHLDGLDTPRDISFSNGLRRGVRMWKDVKVQTHRWLGLEIPANYNSKERSHSSQILKDTSRLLHSCNIDPSSVHLYFP